MTVEVGGAEGVTISTTATAPTSIPMAIPIANTPLTSCPLASPRAAWAWHTRDDRPTTFAVTSLLGDEGSGLFAVLDYRDWIPGAASIARAAFDECQRRPNFGPNPTV